MDVGVAREVGATEAGADGFVVGSARFGTVDGLVDAALAAWLAGPLI